MCEYTKQVVMSVDELCSLSELHVFKLNINIDTEHALVLDFSVLGNHQNVFFGDQMLNDILELTC